MISCTATEVDYSDPVHSLVWRIIDFCAGLLNAESTHASALADQLDLFLARPAMLDARIKDKTASCTSDGGKNMNLDVATGRNGLVDLPDHLDPVFELENFSVNLDLDLEDLNDELFNDLQGVLMGSQDMS